MAQSPSTAADPRAEGSRREQRAWYFYDWANSAFVTTTATVLFGPYLTVIAKSAACPGQDSALACHTDLHILGVPIAPGSLALYTVTFSTLLSALVLPIVGAWADRTGAKRRLLGAFAWLGAVAASLMYFVQGSNWQLGVATMIVASLALGSSLVVYDSILIDIATPDERDRVSSRGWALGYLGGGLLLLINLVLVGSPEKLGLSTGMAVRLSLLSAGVWWGIFTLIPYLGLRDRPGTAAEPGGGSAGGGSLVGASFGQLRDTLLHLRGYRQTWMFLLAYLFFNDGIQTVISSSSIYGQEQLGFATSQLMTTILLVQFIAFIGALAFGWLAARVGAFRTVLGSLGLWALVVIIAFFMPAHAFTLFLALAVLIGLVMGGSQALSRSLFSQLIPLGREAEYFSLYQATERGTSWFGTLLFGLVFQWTGSYRNAIVALIVFFILGAALLSRVDVRRGIIEAGNELPRIL